MTAAFRDAPDAAAYRMNTGVLAFALRVLDTSQAAFARTIKVDPATVSRILSGDRTTAAVARRIVDQFPGLRVGELVDLGELSDAPRGLDRVDTTAEVPPA